MTQQCLEGARKEQVEESERLLSLFYSSKKEFHDDFKWHIGKLGAEEFLEFYFYVLTKLSEAVLGNETDIFKKLLSLVDCISGLDPKTRTHSHESENPLKGSNLVILACKYNRPEILKCLLHCSGNILNILVADMPELIDIEKHNAFYYAIRSGNVELLNTLINEWPNEYFASDPEKLDGILAKAYAELKLKNVLLSVEVEIYVESKLLDLRFHANSSSQGKCSQYNFNIIKKRIILVTENIDFLIKNYSDEQKVDDKFLFVAKFIAQNIHILKRQLKSTYDKLPWEEIEFCLICFVSSCIKPKEINLFYKSTLNKVKILIYLKSFSKKLKDETDFINWSVGNLKELSNLPREQIVAEILRKSPEFEELYNDYQKLRDVCSLEKISDYLKLALSANPQEQEDQIIITRAIQIIGEHLKNTLESPKLSRSTSERLLSSLSSDTKRILNDLRNALSHSCAIPKKVQFENANLNFFTGVQNDMKKIDTLVTGILHRNKIKNISAILESLVSVKSPDEIEAFSDMFSYVTLNKTIPENIEVNEHESLEKCIKEFNDIIVDKTDFEKELFEQIDEMIDLIGDQSKDFEEKYECGLKQLKRIVMLLTGGRTDKTFMEDLKSVVAGLSKYIAPETEVHHFRKVVELSSRIYLSVSRRLQGKTLDKLRSLRFKILWIASFGNDLKWIEKFQEELTGKPSISTRRLDFKNEIPGNYCKSNLKLKQHKLKSILNDDAICSSANKNFAVYKNNKLQSIVEMLVLDIMSILKNSTNFIEDNHSFLDDSFPLLTGKCLRNHLAHDNTIVELLPLDPAVAVILNAQKFTNTENVVKSNKNIGKSQEIDPSLISLKFNQDFLILKNQDLMFSALAEGDLSGLKNCLQNGADIYARSVHLRTSPHFASMASNLDVAKYIHGLDVSFNVEDISGLTPLHIAAELGKQSMVEFLIEEVGLPVDAADNSEKTPLHLAAKNGHVGVVRTLLKNKASTLTQDTCDFIPMHYAVIHNHIDVVKILIEEDKDFDINEVINGNTPLYLAAGIGNLELVDFLLQNKADVNVKNVEDRIALHAAARYGHAEVVAALIEKGANMLVQTKALLEAVAKGHEEVVSTLLQHGTRVDVRVLPLGLTPLHIAARDGCKKIVTSLLKYKADLNETNFEGKTSLHLATNNGHLEIVADLLDRGADIHAKDEVGLTSLHIAAENGNSKISKLLIRHGAEVDARAANGATPLHFSARKGHKEVVDLIIKKADVNAEDNLSYRPLHLAVRSGRIEVIDTLIKNEAEINVSNSHGVTPLYMAAIDGHRVAVISLIKHKAEVDTKNKNGYTSLCAAILQGHKDVAQVLIEHGAQVNISCKNWSLLSLAAQGGSKEIIELLLANGADVNMRVNNRTPLISAVVSNRKEIVEMLIKNGADINESDGAPIINAIFTGFKDIVEILLKYKAQTNLKLNNNSTLLHLAAHRGNKKIVHSLLNKGMEIDAMTVDNRTPLYIACQAGYDDVVDLLITNKADVNAMCAKETPLHAAAKSGYERVVKILLNNGAKIDTKDIKNTTASEKAVRNGHLEVVKILFGHEAGIIKTSDNDGCTLLHIASKQNHIEMVKYLVIVGSAMNAKNALGLKPVHVAARNGGKDTIEFFLNNGVSFNDVDSNEGTILHHAAASGSSDVVGYLLANGAVINCRDRDGSTSMHVAANIGSEATVKILLKHGVFYNAVDKFNKKPLHISEDKNVTNLLKSIEKLFDAVKRKNPAGVRSSLEEGAFVDAKSADSKTALHYATEGGNVEVLKILLENGANPNSVCEKGFTPLHYAAKFSHFKAVLALLCTGAIYNAVSACGKTPLDFSRHRSIDNLLRLVNKSFVEVQNGNCRIINDLNRLNDIEKVKAIMNASNKENHTLVVAAMHCKFPKTEDLQHVFQGHVNDDLRRAYRAMQQRDFQVCLSILQSLFEKRKEIFGLNNPATLDIESHIADMLLKQGKYQESLSILENICVKRTQILGIYHQDTLETKGTIAFILHKQEKNEEAFTILNEVYPKQKEILGPNHKDTLDTQVSLALVMERLKKYEEAVNLLQETYETWKSISGENYWRAVSAQQNIGMVLSAQGKFEEAQKMYRNVLEKNKIVFGSDHPETAHTLFSVAVLLLRQKKYRDSWSTFQKVLDIRRNNLGPMHPDTLLTQFNMGSVLVGQGKGSEAIKIYRSLMDPVKEVFGSEHPIFLKICQTIESVNVASKIAYGYDAIQLFEMFQINYTATSDRDVKTVEHLIQDGFDVKSQDIDGKSMLHYAISSGNADVVNLLLEKEADPTQATNEGETSLHLAVAAGRNEIVDILLQHVAPDKLSNFINMGMLTSENTSLHIAVENGSLEIVKSLLKYGAIYNITNKEGKTPVEVCQDENVSSFLKMIDDLFEATAEGNSEIISKLKALKSDEFAAVTNARNNERNTLLQVALINKHQNVAIQLLQLIKKTNQNSLV